LLASEEVSLGDGVLEIAGSDEITVFFPGFLSIFFLLVSLIVLRLLSHGQQQLLPHRRIAEQYGLSALLAQQHWAVVISIAIEIKNFDSLNFNDFTRGWLL
jgi:hypothetical protein